MSASPSSASPVPGRPSRESEPGPTSKPPANERTVSQRVDDALRDSPKHLTTKDVVAARRDAEWFGEEAVRADLATLISEHPGVIPDRLFEELVAHLCRAGTSDGGANGAMSMLRTVCLIVSELKQQGHDIDPTCCDFRDFMVLVAAYREGKGRNARALQLVRKKSYKLRQAPSLSKFNSALKVLHLAAGNAWIMDEFSKKEDQSYRRTLVAWGKEDAEYKANAPMGEKVRSPAPPLGYTTPGPVTLADLVVYNARSLRELRDQCWVLLAGETAATMPQLKMMKCSDVDAGRLPNVKLSKRAEAHSRNLQLPISRPLARLLRRLIDSVSTEHGMEAPLFQSLMKDPSKGTWSGSAMMVPGWPAALRAVMTAAGEASSFRAEPMATVRTFIERLTPKSPGQGFLDDCVEAGFDVPAVTVYIGLDYVDRVSSVKKRIVKRKTLSRRSASHDA